MSEKVKQLKARLAQAANLNLAAGVLGWDQQVNMPPGGAEARGEQVTTLSTIAHEIITAEETGTLLEAAETEVTGLDYNDDEASLVRVARRNYDKQTKIPTELVAEMSRVTTQAFGAWRQAREENNYPLFAPYLQKIVDLNIRIAEILGYAEHPYDALLDRFEPGITTAQVTHLFDDLKTGLVPLIRDIAERGKPVDDSFFHTDYNEGKQWDVTLALLRDIGYDFNRGRQDRAPHPFTTNFSCNDVRVTTRIQKNHPLSAIFSSVHEGGHALYEQGIPERFDRTPLSGGATLGLHESQSRLWENMLGRSRAFWQYLLPIMRAFFPENLTGVDLEQAYRAVNKVKPSLIRVEADEVTYNLHIFVRFELEQSLVKGDLKVTDVPAAWSAKYEEYLGITPPSDTEGCLQDIHWSYGTIGYFPTYTLGNIIAAQLYNKMKADLPDLEVGFARGEFLPLLTWMREHIHKHGSKFTAPELLQRELGEEIRAQPLLDYMHAKYTKVYEL